MTAPRRLVVLRALNLGDLLVVVPALRALRRHFPDHELTLVTHGWLEPVAGLIGGVDRFRPTRGLAPLTSPRRPDVAVNLHAAGGESAAALDALDPRRRIGYASPGWPGPPWRSGGHERRRWCDLLTAHGIPADPADLLLRPPPAVSPAPGAAVVHVGAGYGAKEWPVERFAAVAAALRERGHRVVVTGSAAQRPRALGVAARAGLPEAAVLAGTTGLPELAALVAGAALLVSGDTGVAHLASAYRRPSVVLFGPAPVEEWGPPEDGPHRALTVAALRRGDPFAADPDPALLGVTVADVLAAVDDLSRGDVSARV
jgi:ADP-heptose:LPS heptosyltransferase